MPRPYLPREAEERGQEIHSAPRKHARSFDRPAVVYFERPPRAVQNTPIQKETIVDVV